MARDWLVCTCLTFLRWVFLTSSALSKYFYRYFVINHVWISSHPGPTEDPSWTFLAISNFAAPHRGGASSGGWRWPRVSPRGAMPFDLSAWLSFDTEEQETRSGRCISSRNMGLSFSMPFHLPGLKEESPPELAMDAQAFLMRPCCCPC